jgi:mRNA degradation ribonuclease J1/J2
LDIIVRGLSKPEIDDIQNKLGKEIKEKISQRKTRDRFLMRKMISEIAESFIFKKIHKRPLVLPVIIEI